MKSNEIPRGEVKFIRHESEVLKGNPLGDPYIRDVIVYLPPGYETSGANYPTVYCLSGFGGDGLSHLNRTPLKPNMPERMDRLIAAGKIRPMIMVMPDCFTYYGGSQYINSTATGNYEDYLTQEIVPFVDANLRTINDRDARAAAGVSSGGYGSLIMGLRHADLFGLICSHAGDAYFQYAQLADFPQAVRAIKGDVKAFLERFWSEEKKDMKDFAGFNAIGMAACYSANGTDFDMPFDLETGELRQDVFDRWLEHDPVFLVEKYVENLKSLRLLYLDAGKRDDFSLDIGARILCNRFRDHGIDFIHEEFDDGHMGIAYRYDRSLKFISDKIK